MTTCFFYPIRASYNMNVERREKYVLYLPYLDNITTIFSYYCPSVALPATPYQCVTSVEYSKLSIHASGSRTILQMGSLDRASRTY